MARKRRNNVYDRNENAIVHCMNHVARRDFVLGVDHETGIDYSYRKVWFEAELKRLAGCFGIDLLTYSILDNHFHLILRSRPDIVKRWCDREVARRWFLLCPKRKQSDGSACEPNAAEINSIVNDPVVLEERRGRLSDISWWMRLISQRIAQRANRETGEKGCFWGGRFKAVRLVDEASLLACSAYVDLNPIRAAMTQRLEESTFTAIKRRIIASQTQANQTQANQTQTAEETLAAQAVEPLGQLSPDSFLAPLEIDEQNAPIGPQPSLGDKRCSDKGFLSMTTQAYLSLLDWTARQMVPGKAGHTPQETPPIFERLGVEPAVWCQLASRFRHMFGCIAGLPANVDAHQAKSGNAARSSLPAATRDLLSA